MNTIEVRAYAKINLALDIISKREDGYHNMKTVMQSVGLHDTLTLTKADGDKLSVSSNLRYIPSDDSNIATRAAKLFFEEIGEVCGLKIDIFKRIPVGAGLAGGSADAAAVLRGLNDMFEAGISTGRLRTMGEKLGSDVPFCIEGGTALAEGRGTELTVLPPLPDCDIVICKPGFSISTQSLFREVKCEEINAWPDIKGMIVGLETGDLPGVSRRMLNVFEPFLPRRYSEIAEIKGKLLELGAMGAVMTGAGSAVFGIFDCADKNKSENAIGLLKKEYKDVFLTKNLQKIIV